MIDNFDPTIGKINLSTFNKNYSDVSVHDNAQGDAVINLDFDHQTIILAGVNANEIHSDNFLM